MMLNSYLDSVLACLIYREVINIRSLVKDECRRLFYSTVLDCTVKCVLFCTNSLWTIEYFPKSLMIQLPVLVNPLLRFDTGHRIKETRHDNQHTVFSHNSLFINCNGAQQCF